MAPHLLYVYARGSMASADTIPPPPYTCIASRNQKAAAAQSPLGGSLIHAACTVPSRAGRRRRVGNNDEEARGDFFPEIFSCLFSSFQVFSRPRRGGRGLPARCCCRAWGCRVRSNADQDHFRTSEDADYDLDGLEAKICRVHLLRSKDS